MALQTRVAYRLEGVDCAVCAADIERALRRELGREDIEVRFLSNEIVVPADAARPESDIAAIVSRIEPGARIRPLDGDGRQTAPDDADRRAARLRLAEAAAAGVLFVLGLSAGGWLRQAAGAPAELAVWLGAYLLAGHPVLRTAASNLIRGRVFDEHFLMTVATLGAIAIWELPEAAAVMLFFAIGERVQDAAVDRSRRSIRALMDVRPETAQVLRGGELLAVPPEEVAVGEEIVVRPGEKAPLDGEVVEGSSWMDTSALTGESVPRRAAAGDAVLAGSISQTGLLRIRVTRPFAESSVSKILALVEEAAHRKAETERFITTFARHYTPWVVAIAAATAFGPPLFIKDAALSEWVYRALVLLVISCPCALVISVPLGYFGGIGGASRRGVLVKGANFLDALARLRTVAFDKTGTLTEGVFEVTEAAAFEGASEEELLDLAAHAEAFSNHPVALSILRAHGGPVDRRRVAECEEIAGLGVKAVIDGRRVIAGNDRMLHEEGVPHQSCQTAGTTVFVAADGRLLGRITIADRIRPDAAEAVRRLRALGVERLVMLTGDDPRVAGEVAATLGLDEARSGLLPEQKVAAIEELMARPGAGPVAYAGDGTNDAPVLVRADVGIAMGGLGSDAAIEAADVVVMDDRPSRIAEAVRIARRTRAIVKQNIAFALGVKGVFVLLGAMGAASIWEAVFADVGVSLLAVLNATRALSGPDR